MKREEEKVKENENIVQIDNKEKITKEKKYFYIILLIIFFIVMRIIIIKFVIPNSDGNEKNINNLKINFLSCSNSMDNLYNGMNSSAYGKGEYVYCKIEFNTFNITDIKEIWFEVNSDEGIEYKEVIDYNIIYSDGSFWTLNQENNKIHLISNISKNNSVINHALKFKIVPSSKEKESKIYLKNIKIKDSKEKYYNVEDNVINLTINEPTNYKYEKDEEKKELVFYKFDDNVGYEEINRYKCQYNDCNVINSYKEETLDLNNGKTLIFENKNSNNNPRYEKIILFDFNKGIISEYTYDIKNIITIKGWNDIKNPIEYYVFRTSDDEMALIDSNGKIIKDFYNQKLVLSCYEGCVLQDFSPKNDMIVTIKNGKYGIEKITSNDIVVEHNYDELSLTDAANVSNNENNLYDKKYYRAKTNDKWYLYNFETKKEITEGYERLYLIDENTILVKIEDYLYIKDFAGNNITDNTIKIKYGLFPFAPKAPEGIRIFKNKNIITISIVDGKNESYDSIEYSTYEYNTETKELTKKSDNFSG